MEHGQSEGRRVRWLRHFRSDLHRAVIGLVGPVIESVKRVAGLRMNERCSAHPLAQLPTHSIVSLERLLLLKPESSGCRTRYSSDFSTRQRETPL